jgi:hypothetical protein
VLLALGTSFCGMVADSGAPDAATNHEATGTGTGTSVTASMRGSTHSLASSSVGSTDAGRDTGTDAGKDSAVEAGRDSGADAGKDSSADAGEDTDAGKDSGVDANVCTIDGGVCGAGATCCSGACVLEQTDPSNCGGCGNVCNDGPSAACGGGICNYTLAAGQSAPYAITVDATSVYWTTGSSVGIGTVTKATPK